ncbi:asparagine synthase-domain-containing protein, partial [Protomyces lactucae-debilis]
ASRGPDALHSIHIGVLTLTASVLHLRGPDIVKQPLEQDHGVLLWNGEIWHVHGTTLDEHLNDTLFLSKALDATDDEGLLHLFGSLRGPFAFCYWNKAKRHLWYGRDILGRRSLLIKHTKDGFILSSVAGRDPSWKTVEPGLYRFDATSGKTDLFPWQPYDSDGPLACYYPPVNPTKIHIDLPLDDHHLEALERHIQQALKVRAASLADRDLAIMYSGGVDCAVLAYYVDTLLPHDISVDLINVSFENPRSLKGSVDLYTTPDRLTGLQGYKELRQRCPHRHWRFVCVNVPYAEALAAKETVLELMYPNESVMDYSIALAFYFCARGKGFVDDEAYETQAKVFISGLGADELLGGYSRHKRAAEQGHDALIAELQQDLDRLPSRNLGRDDRVISHFGREVRWPFLDESLVRHLAALPVSVKMQHAVPGGDKLLLRQLAIKIGLPKAAAEAKRAIQFGSRSAKM